MPRQNPHGGHAARPQVCLGQGCVWGRSSQSGYRPVVLAPGRSGNCNDSDLMPKPTVTVNATREHLQLGDSGKSGWINQELDELPPRRRI